MKYFIFIIGVIMLTACNPTNTSEPEPTVNQQAVFRFKNQNYGSDLVKTADQLIITDVTNAAVLTLSGLQFTPGTYAVSYYKTAGPNQPIAELILSALNKVHQSAEGTITISAHSFSFTMTMYTPCGTCPGYVEPELHTITGSGTF